MKILSFILFMLLGTTAYAQQLGSDRDAHGCIPSAGYTWSEAQKDCIRLFEKGIRVESTDSTRQQVFIVFSPDSTLAEIFLPNCSQGEILYRRNLPKGGYAWNIEDDDTKNVRLIEGIWTISQRGKVIYKQKQYTCCPKRSCKKTCDKNTCCKKACKKKVCCKKKK